MLKKLADYYETSTDYILGRTNSPLPPAEEPPFDYRIIFQQEDAGKAFVLAHALKQKYNISEEEYSRWGMRLWSITVSPINLARRGLAKLQGKTEQLTLLI